MTSLTQLFRYALAGLALAAGSAAQSRSDTPYYFTTLAGISAYGHTDGTGPAARFEHPTGIALDAVGNAYVADAGNHLIRKITPTGVVTTLAGQPGVAGRTDGRSATASFEEPVALALDAAGVLFVLDASGFHTPPAGATLRRITPQGDVSTIPIPDVRNAADGSPLHRLALEVAAGRISLNVAQAFARSTLVPASDVSTLAVDSAGNIYKENNGTICKFTPDGTITTVAGKVNDLVLRDGVCAEARFADIRAMAVDRAGNILIVDSGNFLRRVTPAGEVRTVAGSLGSDSYDGAGSAASFEQIGGLAVALDGTVVLTDRTTVRTVASSGAVHTLAGLSKTEAFSHRDGSGTAARLGFPDYLALAPSGDLVFYCVSPVEILGSHLGRSIRRVTPTGAVSTAFTVGSLLAFACDPQGNLFGVDVNSTSNTFQIVRFDERGLRTPLADGLGGGIQLGALDLACGADGSIYFLHRAALDQVSRSGKTTPRGAADALFGGLAQDRLGNVYAAEPTRIAKLAADRGSSVLPGSENWPGTFADPGFDLFPPLAPPFTVDTAGNIFFVSRWGVFRQTPGGEFQPLAGQANPKARLGYSSCVDGVGTHASFRDITDIVYDETSGAIYVLDDTTIRKGVPAGPVTLTTQPQSQNATVGTAVQFSVTATGIPTPTYQWRFNGAPLAGATAATLSLPSVTAANAGDYTVVVTNPLGTATSSVAALTVATAPAPPSTPTSSSGGGGALGGWFALAFLSLGVARQLAAKSVSPRQSS